MKNSLSDVESSANSRARYEVPTIPFPVGTLYLAKEDTTDRCSLCHFVLSRPERSVEADWPPPTTSLQTQLGSCIATQVFQEGRARVPRGPPKTWKYCPATDYVTAAVISRIVAVAANYSGHRQRGGTSRREGGREGGRGVSSGLGRLTNTLPSRVSLSNHLLPAAVNQNPLSALSGGWKVKV